MRFLFVVVASNRERPFVRRTFCKRPAIALYLCGNCFRDLMGKRMKYAVWAAVAMIFALHAACLQPSRSRLLPCAGPVETIAAAGTLDELHELIVSAWACDLVPAVCGSNSVQVHIPVLRLPSHGRDGWQCPVPERPKFFSPFSVFVASASAPRSRKRDIMSWPCGKSLFSRFEFQASGTRLRCGSLPQAWADFPGESVPKCRLGTVANRKGMRPGLPGMYL